MYINTISVNSKSKKNLCDTVNQEMILSGRRRTAQNVAEYVSMKLNAHTSKALIYRLGNGDAHNDAEAITKWMLGESIKTEHSEKSLIEEFKDHCKIILGDDYDCDFFDRL